MFNVTDVPETRWGEVAFEILGDNGKTIPQAFSIEVKVEDVDQAGETYKRLQADALEDDSLRVEILFVEYYVVNWKDIGGADKKPLGFSLENLRMVMRIHEARVAIINKVIQLVNRTELLRGN